MQVLAERYVSTYAYVMVDTPLQSSTEEDCILLFLVPRQPVPQCFPGGSYKVHVICLKVSCMTGRAHLLADIAVSSLATCSQSLAL